jgi:hypothetical protein
MDIQTADFDRNVFVNCPFDSAYRPLLFAMLFALKACGLEPRIAAERGDSGELRFRKIVELIKSSKYCVHDISRMETAAVGDLPRFNMPFELGLDLGLRESAVAPLNQKCCVILDTERYRFHRALSDLAGVDVKEHADSPERLVKQLRTWLVEAGMHGLPAGSTLWRKYKEFETVLNETLQAKGYAREDIESLCVADFLMHLHFPGPVSTVQSGESAIELDLMRAAEPFPIPDETIAECLDLADPAESLFATAWRGGLDAIPREARRGALLGAMSRIAESVIEVIFEPFGYTSIHHFSHPGLHGVDLLLLAPDQDAVVAVQVAATLRSNHVARLTKRSLVQMSGRRPGRADNPGTTERERMNKDVYGAIVAVNLADRLYRVAFTADFKSLLPVTAQEQLTNLGWLTE